MLVGIPVTSSQTQNTEPVDLAKYMAGLLVTVAEKRCRQSYAKIFQHFAPRLRSYAINQMKNETQAMELVQDTMANVWQKAHLFNGDKGSPSTWIFTIARNIRFDMLRKQQNRQHEIQADDLWPVLTEQTPAADEKSLEETMTLEQIGQLFNSLPDKQRQVIEAIYIDGKSQQEVADSFGIPLGTVKSRARLALQRLKYLLNDHD